MKRRDRRAAKRDHGQAERQQPERQQAERERAEREQAEREATERERAAQAERERAEQERAERERAEKERAAQAERERDAQAEHERAEKERAAQAERAAEAERAAQAERERAETAGTAQADEAAAERAEQARRASPPDQAQPDGLAEPGRVASTVVDQPWRPLGLRKPPTRRRSRTVVLAVGVAALLAAGPLMLALSHHGGPKPSAAEVTRNEAAAWVAQQVSDNNVVSCDVTMCLALKAQGVSVGRLLVLGGTHRDILGSQVVVSTATIRDLFGSRLSSAYAPTVLASFGSGKTRIDVRVVAPDGSAAAYLSALQSDLQQRKEVGAQLANVQQIRMSTVARKQMISGQVSAQLLIVLTSLGGYVHSLDVIGFGDAGPSASPDVPLRSVYLAENRGASVVRSMLAFLNAQPTIYRPAHAGTTRFDGQPALFIEFDAPVPLGLINGPNQ